MRWIIYSIVVLLLAFAASTAALGCSCFWTERPVSQDVNESAAVFLGRAVAAWVVERQVIDNHTWTFLLTTFRVSQSWKGIDDPGTVDVFSVWGNDSCAYSFTLGSEYLVFARHNGQGELSAGMCSRTSPKARAASTISALGTPEKTFSHPPVPSS